MRCQSAADSSLMKIGRACSMKAFNPFFFSMLFLCFFMPSCTKNDDEKIIIPSPPGKELVSLKLVLYEKQGYELFPLEEIEIISGKVTRVPFGNQVFIQGKRYEVTDQEGGQINLDKGRVVLTGFEEADKISDSDSPGLNPSNDDPAVASGSGQGHGEEKARESPVRLSEPPPLINKVEPEYPEFARSFGVYGDIFLDVTIDKEGKVKECLIVRSIPLLDQPAVDAVKKWVYEPFLENGEPKVAIFQVLVKFKLPSK